MNLWEEYAEETGKCVILNKQTQLDGYGGYKTTYAEGAEFNATITLEDSIQAKVAEQQGVTGLYKIMFPKELRLQYHDIFMRKSDKKIFRVTDKDDNHTPDSSSLDLRYTYAEEWKLTDDG